MDPHGAIPRCRGPRPRNRSRSTSIPVGDLLDGIRVAFLLVGLGATGCSAHASCKVDGECPVGQICTNGGCQAAMCTEDWRPVCGEDGKTYGNACAARLAHVSVTHEGECTGSGLAGKTCGTIAGLRCDPGQFCNLRAGMCKAADADGTCVVKPETCDPTLAPVCGCDGKTYDNDCKRIQSEVGKDHDGACEVVPK